jgi:hypothetical protein
MKPVLDTFDTGTVVAATLAPAALVQFEPVLRRLLGGTQHFVKQSNGRYRPSGCSLGLGPQCFDFSELVLVGQD